MARARGSGSAPPLAAARSLAELLPELMIAARVLAATVQPGWHGHRRAGIGDDFWQFRPLSPGESVRAVDWRRSAREGTLFIREREQETPHTLWLWADLSPSMDYRSPLAQAVKRDRALVLALALGLVAAHAGERVGVVGAPSLSGGAGTDERLARQIVDVGDAGLDGDLARLRRRHDVVLVGDWLDPVDRTAGRLDRLASLGVRAHLVAVSDPGEETFPFTGRTDFVDPENGSSLRVGRAESWREDYLVARDDHMTRIAALAARPGWSFLAHRTDRPASGALVALGARLSQLDPGTGDLVR